MLTDWSKLRYVDFSESFYHGMSGMLVEQGNRVSKLEIKLDGKNNIITFYNHQITKEEVNPFG